MSGNEFTEVELACPDCEHSFPIMVHSDRGSTLTICESCMNRLEVSVNEGEVTDIQKAA